MWVEVVVDPDEEIKCSIVSHDKVVQNNIIVYLWHPKIIMILCKIKLHTLDNNMRTYYELVMFKLFSFSLATKTFCIFFIKIQTYKLLLQRWEILPVFSEKKHVNILPVFINDDGNVQIFE